MKITLFATLGMCVVCINEGKLPVSLQYSTVLSFFSRTDKLGDHSCDLFFFLPLPRAETV